MGKSFFFGVIISASMSLWAGDPIADEAIVKEYLTPYKLGKPILAPSGVEGEFDQLAVDHPRVFVHNDRVYLMYIGYDGISYQTALAVSDDMLHWQKLGIVFKRNASTNLWDKTGRAISGFLRNVNLWEPPTLTKKDGKYWLFYHAYPSKGYEGGAASNGIAWTTDESFLNWTSLSWRRVLTKIHGTAPDFTVYGAYRAMAPTGSTTMARICLIGHGTSKLACASPRMIRS